MSDLNPDLARSDSISYDPDLHAAGLDRSMSEPVFPSPRHQHWRVPSMHRQVKETLNARTEYSENSLDGASFYKINQYVIKQEIGRGSFGAVHLAVDQYGQEYAVKEFSKSRLRKRAQSDMLRRRLGPMGPKLQPKTQTQNPVDFIRGEVAIMKKLDHNNLVSLIEVLDDPDEDSLYMVMEMCKKGVVMTVNIDQVADPYDLEICRCWFRDMILGVEYLHAQGVVHRDIKPDNCLLTEDNVLKISDFGVSEMFETESGMMTSKSAGSPAFMPPELCVPKHGEVSGQATDIWSMGVTLYCLRYGHLPFEQSNIMGLFQSILTFEPELGECDEDFCDLMHRLLEKDPFKRITMDELRVHPWVTRDGSDPLMSKEENTAHLIEPPTQQEVNHAITGHMTKLVTLMRAATRFKSLLKSRIGILGGDSRVVPPPGSASSSTLPAVVHRANTTPNIVEGDNRRFGFASTPRPGPGAKSNLRHPIEYPPGTSKADYDESDVMDTSMEEMMSTTITIEKTTAESSMSQHLSPRFPPGEPVSAVSDIAADRSVTPSNGGDIHSFPTDGKGQAHDPLQDTLYLGIGPGPAPDPGEGDANTDQPDLLNPIVSESPVSTDENIFERAFWGEISRIITKDQDENPGHRTEPHPGRDSGSVEASGSARCPPSELPTGSAEGDRPGLVRRPTLYLTKRVEHSETVRKLAGDYLFESTSDTKSSSRVSTTDTAIPPGTTMITTTTVNTSTSTASPSLSDLAGLVKRQFGEPLPSQSSTALSNSARSMTGEKNDDSSRTVQDTAPDDEHMS